MIITIYLKYCYLKHNNPQFYYTLYSLVLTTDIMLHKFSTALKPGSLAYPFALTSVIFAYLIVLYHVTNLIVIIFTCLSPQFT